MKNIIFLVVDSFAYREFERYGREYMPFVHQLMAESYCATRIYSMGPHTELGMRSLLCSANTLDYGGDLLRYEKCPKIMFDFFVERGYEVHAITYPGNAIPTRLFQSKSYYEHFTKLPKFEDYWPHRLKHFADLLEQRELDQREWNNLIELFETAYTHVHKFFDSADSEYKDYGLVSEMAAMLDFKRINTIMADEYRRYLSDQKKYLRALLQNPGECKLFGLIDEKYEEEYNKDFLDFFFRNYGSFLKDLRNRTLRANLFHDVDWESFFRGLPEFLWSKVAGRERKDRYILNWKTRALSYRPFFARRPLLRKTYYLPSFKKQLRTVYEITEKHTKSDAPFCIYLQPEELHFINNWCSYDLCDYDNIKREMDSARQALDRLPRGFSGNISYLLGMRYVDDCIRELFDTLTRQGLLENTGVIITADHGSSFGSYPVRNSLLVNNWYSENYNIPFIYYGCGKKGIDRGLHENIDILPTILDSLEFQYGGELEGKSFWNGGSQAVVHSEYTGPGCPDTYEKDIWFMARNGKYSIYYVCRLKKPFEEGQLCAVYDMEQDYTEKKNLAAAVHREDIEPLLAFLRKRFDAIRHDCGIV